MLEINQITPYLLAIFTVSLLYVYWYFQRTYKYWKTRNVPDITPIFPFGNFLDVIIRKVTLGQSIGEYYLDFKKRGLKHGGLFALHRPLYIPVDPEIIKHIMITDSHNFPNRGFYTNEDGDPLSGHIFTMEGNKWRDLRSNIPKAFTTTKMKQILVMIVDLAGKLQEHLDRCQRKCPNGINIRNEMSKFTTDVTSRCIFGFESNTMKDENIDLMKHARSFFDHQFYISKNVIILNLPIKILKLINFKVFKTKNTKFVLDMFGQLNKYRREGNNQRDDLAHTLLALTETREQRKNLTGSDFTMPLNDTQCISHMWAFFCASFETSSATITFALYELSKNPLCQQKLREEINSILVKHGNQITYDSVMEMKYLDNVINETLRLYPILPILPRVCKADYKIPGTDTVLEKNTFVMVSNYGIHRDPEYYPDPLKFDPDRFIPSNKGKRPFISYMPFGEGPRYCIGKRLGLLQTKVGLLTTIKKYEVSLNPQTTSGCNFGPWELILRKDGNIWIDLKEVK